MSPRARAAADRARRRAQDEMPTPDALAGMTIDAAMGADAMTPAEIRRLAADAISQSRQISYLLGRLAELLNGSSEQEGP